MPKKKQVRPISEQEEIANKWISKIRVRIEHVLVSVKSYRVVSDLFRSRLFRKEDIAMVIACAIHNLNLKSKSFIKP